jgi:transposase
MIARKENNEERKQGQNQSQGRRYSEEFKRNAVELLGREGSSVREVAEGLGMTQVTLRQWRRQLTGHRPKLIGLEAAPDRTTEQLEAENRRLRAELDQITMQRDILKKACGILSLPTKGTPL